MLLPEMPFSIWLASDSEVEPEAWARAVSAHRTWMTRLPELGAGAVLGTRPVITPAGNRNQSFAWEREAGERQPVHHKRYLPQEEDFWEAAWYSPGDGSFSPVALETAKVGFLICTEMWFFEHARDYGRAGVQILASPRATLASSVDKWLAGGRAAAVVSGAFGLSSNLAGPTATDGVWGGTGWVVEPEEGEVLGTTSDDLPFLTVEIDLAVADAAKHSYPRYVRG